MRILLTDEPVDAAEAYRIGLVNEVVPLGDLLSRAEEIARHIATMPPIATRMMKEFVVRFGEARTDEAWQVQNLINTLLIQTTADGDEGRRAFNEKRPPNFTGAIRQKGEPFPEPAGRRRLREVPRQGGHQVARGRRGARRRKVEANPAIAGERPGQVGDLVHALGRRGHGRHRP